MNSASSTDKFCYVCLDTNALTCTVTETSSNKLPLTCKPGYVLNNNVCVACSDTNALTCNSTLVALTCKTNYAFNGTNCNKCVDTNALTCLVSNLSVSLTCATGYYLEDSTLTCKAY